jgi:hypothetical protein
MPTVAAAPLLRRVPTIVLICLAIDVALCLLYIANFLLGQPSPKLTTFSDLNGESSLAMWYSSTQLFGIAVLGTIFAHRKIREDPRAILLAGLPLLFLLMSIDEAVQIHEWLGRKSDVLLSGGTREGSAMAKTGIWMFVLGLPFLALFLGWAWSIRNWTADKPHCLWIMVGGMLLLLTGAIGFEFASNWTTGVMYTLGVVAEEFCEMMGATIILWAVYEMAIGDWQLQPMAPQPA